MQNLAKGAQIAAGYGRLAASIFPNSKAIKKVSGILNNANDIADALSGGGAGYTGNRSGPGTAKGMSEVISQFGRLAQTSHYEVSFAGFMNLSNLSGFLRNKGVDTDFITRELGLLCSSASLPTSRYAISEVTNFMGVRENFAHTRSFVPIDLTFYVDKEYKTLKFFEHWMEYIASGAETRDGIFDKARPGYYVRMKYPQQGYKCDTIQIKKFDRDYQYQIEYNFIGCFPVDIVAVPVSYEGSQILQMTVTMGYDRYVCGAIDSKSISQGTFGNFIPQLGGLAIASAAAFGGTSALGKINSAANSLAGISRNARDLQGSIDSVRQRFI